MLEGKYSKDRGVSFWLGNIVQASHKVTLLLSPLNIRFAIRQGHHAADYHPRQGIGSKVSIPETVQFPTVFEKDRVQRPIATV